MLFRTNRYLISDDLNLAFNEDFKSRDLVVFLGYNAIHFVMYLCTGA